MGRYSRFVWVCFLIFLMILLGLVAYTQGAGVKVYQISPDKLSPGQIIRVNNKKLKVTEVNQDGLIQSVRILSQNNENTKYWVRIKTSSFPEIDLHRIVLDIDGFTIKVDSIMPSKESGKRISFYPIDNKTASKIASHFNVELENREHPGYKLLTRFIKNDKDSFVTLEITNVGDKSIRFRDGGMGRGARNNQFGFIAFQNNQALKDIGSPVHFGGFVTTVTLKPGEKFTKKEDLSKWFDLSKKGYYEITGLFYLAFCPAPKDDIKGFFHRVIWEDYAAAKFTFTIE